MNDQKRSEVFFFKSGGSVKSALCQPQQLFCRILARLVMVVVIYGPAHKAMLFVFGQNIIGNLSGLNTCIQFSLV